MTAVDRRVLRAVLREAGPTCAVPCETGCVTQ